MSVSELLGACRPVLPLASRRRSSGWLRSGCILTRSTWPSGKALLPMPGRVDDSRFKLLRTGSLPEFEDSSGQPAAREGAPSCREAFTDDEPVNNLVVRFGELEAVGGVSFAVARGCSGYWPEPGGQDDDDQGPDDAAGPTAGRALVASNA